MQKRSDLIFFFLFCFYPFRFFTLITRIKYFNWLKKYAISVMITIPGVLLFSFSALVFLFFSVFSVNIFCHQDDIIALSGLYYSIILGTIFDIKKSHDHNQPQELFCDNIVPFSNQFIILICIGYSVAIYTDMYQRTNEIEDGFNH